MRVKLDCEAKYLTEEDPWGIGEANSKRYERYVESIRLRARGRTSVLDVGCGFGAMLARLRPDFERLHGIELSADAIAKGAERYPFIAFEQGSIEALGRTEADRSSFDAIVFSDVLYYVDEAGKRSSLRWIAEHLNPGGIAFIAAYSPGTGEYLTPAEVRTLVEREFVIEHEELLESQHLVLIARPRRRMAALTLDYETWQPVPAGRQIDWEADVFAPTDALLDACDAEQARLTIFAELGEHAYLRQHQPELADRMEAQWREAIQRGHDVQMHLHPNWLPELGARAEHGRYVWDETLTRADDHPDLMELIGRLKRTLEAVIRPVDPTYETVAFRAGGYEAQPFRRLAAALEANGMWCDTSVYYGGGRRGRYHDYAHPYDSHQPWFASHVDPQLKAPPAEQGIVELPVATFARNDRWIFDTEEGARFGDRLLTVIERDRRSGPSTELARVLAKARGLGAAAYGLSRAQRHMINRVLPASLAGTFVDYPHERLVDDDFYVAVGHSKADLDIAAIRGQLRALREGGVEVVRISDMARLAREQLERDAGSGGEDQVLRPAGRVRSAGSGEEPGETRSSRLRAMIPLDRNRLLDLSGGIGEGAAQIAASHPWMRVTGVDAKEAVVASARAANGSSRVEFEVADSKALPFPDDSFDCVYADAALERAPDVDAALAEIRRVLCGGGGGGGVLIATIAPDAYDTRRTATEHAWKTSAADVRERLRDAGFLDISVEERDSYRFGGAPYPPASDRVLYVRAWRRERPLPRLERVDALRRWTHARLDPSRSSESFDPAEVLHGGHAYCAGMTLVLGEALAREGYEPRWVTMVAHEHPRGRGAHQADTHEAIELTLADHSVHLLDPMADVRFPYALQALIEDPSIADGIERERDGVYVSRGYDLYATSFWYRRVVAVAVRNRLRGPQRFVPARWVAHAGNPAYQALAAGRARGWRELRRLRDV